MIYVSFFSYTRGDLIQYHSNPCNYCNFVYVNVVNGESSDNEHYISLQTLTHLRFGWFK